MPFAFETFTAPAGDFMLALHGGAGGSRATASAEADRDAEDALRSALEIGREVLASGGPALEAVIAAVESLESAPCFNAGIGAALNEDGFAELDASVMCGASGRAGAVAAVRNVLHPVRLARELLEAETTVFLVHEGAERRADALGLVRVPAETFVIPARAEELARARERGEAVLDHDGQDAAQGTVGAIARDRAGCLAAATSTGGLTNKPLGRVGDSAVIGAGTFASERCAISCTGKGEYFLRAVAAHDLDARLRYGAQTLTEAARGVLARVAALGGHGGLIALCDSGDAILIFDTARMYRAYVDATGPAHVAIGSPAA